MIDMQETCRQFDVLQVHHLFRVVDCLNLINQLVMAREKPILV